MSESKTPPEGWIIFDGSCGACSHFVGGRADFYRRIGFEVVARQEPWIAQKLTDLERDEQRGIQDGIRLLLPDGSIIIGADVYRVITAKVWWLYPIHIFSRLPLSSSLFDLGYSLFLGTDTVYLMCVGSIRRHDIGKSLSHICDDQNRDLSDDQYYREEADICSDQNSYDPDSKNEQINAGYERYRSTHHSQRLTQLALRGERGTRAS